VPTIVWFKDWLWWKVHRNSINAKVLGLQVDNHLNWKNHVDVMIPNLSRICCAIRSVSHVSSIDTLKSIYFAYFHSVMKYGIVF
jgi:hypothetical protein